MIPENTKKYAFERVYKNNKIFKNTIFLITNFFVKQISR
jgi:hypothetical protein